jgi:cytidine deaminase
MVLKNHSFEYQVHTSKDTLSEEDSTLMEEARAATSKAYAPYSNFHVGAAALLSNGSIVSGANQENASFPAGICAERVVLAAVSALHQGATIVKMAITYVNERGASDTPVSPCGVCRQALAEHIHCSAHPMYLILGGMEGEIWTISNALSLLPMSFSGNDLKK